MRRCTALHLAAKHDLATYLTLLRTNGKCVVVGAPAEPFLVHSFNLLMSEFVLLLLLRGVVVAMGCVLLALRVWSGGWRCA